MFVVWIKLEWFRYWHQDGLSDFLAYEDERAKLRGGK